MNRHVLVGLCLLLSVACATTEPPSIFEQTGKRLRADIESAYRELRRQDQLDMDITNVIQEYLPAGIPFNDAEGILRAAGFTVSPRLPPKRNDPVSASIQPLHSEPHWTVSVTVMLEAPGPGDYSMLRRASGSLHTVMH